MKDYEQINDPIINIMKLFEIPLDKKEEFTRKIKALIKDHSTSNKRKTIKWPIRRPQCIQTFLNIRLFPSYQKKIKLFCQEHYIKNQKAFELELMNLVHFYCKMDLFFLSEYKFYKHKYHKTKRQMFNDFIKVADKELVTVRPPCKELYGCKI